MPNKEAHNGIESYKMSGKTPTSPPLEKQPASPSVGMQHLSPSAGVRSVNSTGRHIETLSYHALEDDSVPGEETDGCVRSRRFHLSDNGTTSFEQCKVSSNTSSSTVNASTPLRRSPGAVRVTEFTCQTKSFIHAKMSSGEMLQVTSLSESSSYGGIVRTCGTNGVHNEESHSEISCNSVLEESHSEECSQKSFVQQRIERLYGPGALAQGFLSRVRKISSSQDESTKQVPQSPMISSGSPQLPVLRHLRPEFRAQLPLTTMPTSKQKCNVSSAPVSASPSEHRKSAGSISLADFQPAAPDVPVIKAETSTLPSDNRSSVESDLIPIISRTVLCRTDVEPVLPEKSSEDTKIVPNPVFKHIEDQSSVEEKNGHHFLQVLHKEIERLNGLANEAELELSRNEGLSEDVQGKLRSASGQARLLMKQKLQQFEGLCNKNISQCPGEAFPTTAQDLEGFWDMVKLQIDHVDQLFAEIDVLRKNDWKEQVTEHTSNPGTANGSRRRPSTRHSAGKHSSVSGSASTTSSSGGARTKVGSSTVSDKKKSDSARRSREEQALARKKLMEERRQALKAQQAKTEQHVEIYVASRNGK